MSLVDTSSGWPSIDPGRMRHSVTIQKQGPTSPPSYDSTGPVLAWSAFATARAAIEIMCGTDVIKSGQTTTQLFLTVAILFQAGILPNMRVLNENGSVYVIQSIENVLEMNQILLLTCVGLGAND